MLFLLFIKTGIASSSHRLEMCLKKELLFLIVCWWMLVQWQCSTHQATVSLLYKRDAAAAKTLQSCPTLCDPIDGSQPGSSVPGILQARTLEWVAISFSSASEWKVKVKSLSPVRLFVTPWTAAYQAPLSMEFSRRECWSGVPLPSLKRDTTKAFVFTPWNRSSVTLLWSR